MTTQIAPTERISQLIREAEADLEKTRALKAELSQPPSISPSTTPNSLPWAIALAAAAVGVVVGLVVGMAVG